VESQKRFGKRIRAVRNTAKFSREFVAEHAGITPNYLGQIERGEKWPALEVIVAIADSLTVSPAAFFDLEPGDLELVALRESLNDLLEHTDKNALQVLLRVAKALLRG
jgi:transcriptional regulator with XRE-family HTH domain